MTDISMDALPDRRRNALESYLARTGDGLMTAGLILSLLGLAATPLSHGFGAMALVFAAVLALRRLRSPG